MFIERNTKVCPENFSLTTAENKQDKFDDWEIAKWELMIFKDKLLGKGSFAKVYLAEWRNTQVVAKVLHDDIDEESKKLIIQEFNTMTKMHHPNIVQLFGYVKEPFIIVMEYFPRGNLLDNVHNFYKSRKIKIAKDICRGLIYLHNRKPQAVIHRDIKPANIFLTRTLQAKIGDFGLSKLLDKKKSTDNFIHMLTISANVGTVRYMAPEAQTDNYDNKVDIYSFGILLYELFEEKRYIPSIQNIWRKSPKNIRNLIMDYMLDLDPNKRLDINSIYYKL